MDHYVGGHAQHLLGMSAIWRVVPRCCPPLACSAVSSTSTMSYNPYKKRGRGPNRGGGRGRGGGGGGGRGRGGGGPPPGLSGKDIGMYYRNKSMAKKKEKEKNEV